MKSFSTTASRRHSMPIKLEDDEETTNSGDHHVGLTLRQPSFNFLVGNQIQTKDGEHLQTSQSNPLIVFEPQTTIPLSLSPTLFAKSLYGEFTPSNSLAANKGLNRSDEEFFLQLQQGQQGQQQQQQQQGDNRREIKLCKSDDDYYYGTNDEDDIGMDLGLGMGLNGCGCSSTSSNYYRPRDRKSQIIMKLRQINAAKWEDIGYIPPPPEMMMNTVRLPCLSVLSA